jgi:hypothetical protein
MAKRYERKVERPAKLASPSTAPRKVLWIRSGASAPTFAAKKRLIASKWRSKS